MDHMWQIQLESLKKNWNCWILEIMSDVSYYFLEIRTRNQNIIAHVRQWKKQSYICLLKVILHVPTFEQKVVALGYLLLIVEFVIHSLLTRIFHRWIYQSNESRQALCEVGVEQLSGLRWHSALLVTFCCLQRSPKLHNIQYKDHVEMA